MRQKRVNPLLQNFEEHGAAFKFCESGFPVEAVCRNSVFRLKINCAYVFLFERIFNSFHKKSAVSFALRFHAYKKIIENVFGSAPPVPNAAYCGTAKFSVDKKSEDKRASPPGQVADIFVKLSRVVPSVIIY